MVKKKTFVGVLLAVFVFLLAVSVYAISVTQMSPAAGSYVLTADGNVTVVCESTPSTNYNITNMSVYHNINGNFVFNGTNSTMGAVNTTINSSVVIPFVPDGESFQWECMACEVAFNNASNSSCTALSAGRTVNVERPPTTSFNGTAQPTDGSWSQARANILGWNVTGSDPVYDCNVWYNSSSHAWGQSAPTYSVSNNTATTANFTFDADGAITWGMRCGPSTNPSNVFDFTANRTLHIDTVNPSGVMTPVDGYFNNTGSVVFTVNVTDVNISTCALWHNETGTFAVNETNASMVSGSLYTFPTIVLGQGNLTWNVQCNDSSSRQVWISSTNYTLMVDTVTPGTTSVGNASAGAFCDRWAINISNSEVVNASVNYGTTTALGTIVRNATYQQNHSIVISNWTKETTYNLNVTVCDMASNCNTTSWGTFATPYPVCTGWTYLTAYDTTLNLSVARSESAAEYVYLWNTTGQAWLYTTSGVTTYDGVSVAYPNVLALYTASNSTWLRSFENNTAQFTYTIQEGNNYLPISNVSYSMANLTRVFQDNSTTYSKWNETFEMWSAFNNTNKLWSPYSHRRWGTNNSLSSLWGNSTTFGRSASDFNMVWFYSEINGTWNGYNVTQT